jgi:dynein heavy chain
MRERHWTLLSDQLGTRLNPGKDFTLVKAEEMKLLEHLGAITKVADVAGKEFSIEQVCEG